MKADLIIVATLDNVAVQVNPKVDFLWSTPNASHVILKRAGLKVKWAKYMPFAQEAKWPHASGQAANYVCTAMEELEDVDIGQVPNVAMRSHLTECSKVRATGNVALLRVF